MIDLRAPIIPEKEAAGISLGTPIDDVLATPGIDFDIEQRHDSNVYKSANIHLFVDNNGRIDQICVKGEYAGCLFSDIRIGASICDIPKKHGPLGLDMEGNCVTTRVPGVCLEYDGSTSQGAILEIYVYKDEWKDHLANDVTPL
jgi:hypothetical protein